MEIVSLALPEVLLIIPKVFGDSRGFFLETYRKDTLAKYGVELDFVQDNHSKSAKDVLRGLHYQADPKAQGKLVRVIAGAVFDVAVDLRKGSGTYGKWVSEILSAENKKMLYVPPGFAHGFAVLEDNTEFVYKCTEYYEPSLERGVIWNDPDIGVKWPIVAPLLSEKDKLLPRLKDI